MKKFTLFIISFFVFNSFLTAELTRAQMWAVSLTGIMTELNRSNRNSLNASAMDESGRNLWLEVIKRDWSISTREELLDMLDSLEVGGHSASLGEIQEIIRNIREVKSESETRTILGKYTWNTAKINRFNYVQKEWEQYRNRSIKAWDLGRSISLCRWGYNVGFLSEEEAWERIFHIAGIIQPLYNSWKEYGYDYFMGRLFWASGFEEEASYFTRTETVYRRLLDSYWEWLDWHVDLEQVETNIPSTQTIRFLITDSENKTRQYWTNDPDLYNKAPYSAFANTNSNPDVYEGRVKKVSGNDDYGYGMIFCVGETDQGNTCYYRFFITVNGRFTVQKYNGNAWEAAPVSWRDSRYLKTGYDVYNTLRVERTESEGGTVFRVYINGNFEISFEDETPLNGKKIGAVASINIMEKEMFPYFPVDVRFDF